jgi:hypothetical protein
VTGVRDDAEQVVDGRVLEVKVDGGAVIDVLLATGTWATDCWATGVDTAPNPPITGDGTFCVRGMCLATSFATKCMCTPVAS